MRAQSVDGVEEGADVGLHAAVPHTPCVGALAHCRHTVLHRRSIGSITCTAIGIHTGELLTTLRAVHSVQEVVEALWQREARQVRRAHLQLAG